MNRKQKIASSGRPYRIVSLIFSALFLLLIAYLIYFQVVRKDEFLSSSKNSRQALYEKEFRRGSILARNGVALAETRTDDSGQEYRYYPYGSLFAQVVGYTSKGKSGLESRYNYNLLSSHLGILEAFGDELYANRRQADHLVTTLDADLTQVAWEALGDHDGAVVVMEAETGNVLCCISKPSFDPNAIDENWDYLNSGAAGSVFLNRGLQGQYPPGSTFKMVTALAGLEQGMGPDGINHTCIGELSSGDYTMHCAGGGVHGEETLSEAFAQSCNTYFAALGLQLDWKDVRKTADVLGMNGKLELDLPTRASCFSANQDSSEALRMQTSIGQGDTLVTPIQMACLAAAVVNGGEMMKPKFVSKLINGDGNTVKTYHTESLGQVMSASNATILTNLMQGVVDHGSASTLNELGIPICGKTGSAQHGDGSMDTHSWFVGFGNTGEQDIAIAVLAESAGSGSSVAVPAAKKLFAAYYSR